MAKMMRSCMKPYPCGCCLPYTKPSRTREKHAWQRDEFHAWIEITRR